MINFVYLMSDKGAEESTKDCQTTAQDEQCIVTRLYDYHADDFNNNDAKEE